MTAPANYLSILENRTKDLPTDQYSYKLGTGSGYGLDVIAVTSELEVDEERMAVWITYADGNNRDGVGDLLEVGGIDYSRHKKNPLSLFDHGKTIQLPIGTVRDPLTGEYKSEVDLVNKTARDKIHFYRGKGIAGIDRRNEYDHAVFCEQLFDLWAKKFLGGASIGYQVLKAQQLPPDYESGKPQGLHLLRVLKLESSIVVMPANADTVSKGFHIGRADAAREILCLGGVCGKRLSPYLVKSLEPYAAAQTTTTFGYQGKSMPTPAKKDCGCGCGGSKGTCSNKGLHGTGVKPGQTDVPFTENLSITKLPKQHYVPGDFLESVKELRLIYRSKSADDLPNKQPKKRPTRFPPHQTTEKTESVQKEVADRPADAPNVQRMTKRDQSNAHRYEQNEEHAHVTEPRAVGGGKTKDADDMEVETKGATKDTARVLAQVGERLKLHENPSPMPGYGQIFTDESRVWYVGGDGDDPGFDKVVEQMVREAYPGASEIIYESEVFPPKSENWVQVYPPTGGMKHIKSADEIVGDLNWLKDEAKEHDGDKALRTTRRNAAQYLRRLPAGMRGKAMDMEEKAIPPNNRSPKTETPPKGKLSVRLQEPNNELPTNQTGQSIPNLRRPQNTEFANERGGEDFHFRDRPRHRAKSLGELRKMYRAKSLILHVHAKDMKHCSAEAQRRGVKIEQVAELPEEMYKVKLTGSSKGLDYFMPDKSGRERASIQNDALANSPMGSEVETTDDNTYPVRMKSASPGKKSPKTTTPQETRPDSEYRETYRPVNLYQIDSEGQPLPRSKPAKATTYHKPKGKAMPVGGDMEQQPNQGDEDMGQHPTGAVLPEEPFGAQIGRRAHKDRMDLMREYHQYLEHCEDEGMRQLLTQLLTTMDEEMTAIEDYFAHHERYSKLPPIEGAVPPEEKPIEGDDQSAEIEGAAPDEAPEGDALESPTPDEAAEGMSLSEEELDAQRGKKSLHNGRGKSKTTNKKGPIAKDTDEGDEEYQGGKGRGKPAHSVAEDTDEGDEEYQGGKGRGKPAHSVAEDTDEGDEESQKGPGKRSRGVAGKTDIGEEEFQHKPGKTNETVAADTDLGDEEFQDKPGRSGGEEDSNFADRDVGFEEGHDPGFEEDTQKEHDKHKSQMLSHHENPIREAQGFLGKLANKPMMEDQDRLEAYHHHRNLDGISDELNGYFGSLNQKGFLSEVAGGAAGGMAGGAIGSAAGPVGTAIGGAAGSALGSRAAKGAIGNAARVVGRAAGTAIGGPAAGEALSSASGAVHDVYDHVLGTDGKKSKKGMGDMIGAVSPAAGMAMGAMGGGGKDDDGMNEEVKSTRRRKALSNEPQTSAYGHAGDDREPQGHIPPKAPKWGAAAETSKENDYREPQGYVPPKSPAWGSPTKTSTENDHKSIHDDDFSALKIQDSAAEVPHPDANTPAPEQHHQGIDEIKPEHPHSPTLKKVSSFLRGLTTKHPSDFGNEDRGAAKFHYECLNPLLETFTHGMGMGDETEHAAADTDVNVGGMGEKDDEDMESEEKDMPTDMGNDEYGDRSGANPPPVIRAKGVKSAMPNTGKKNKPRGMDVDMPQIARNAQAREAAPRAGQGQRRSAQFTAGDLSHTPVEGKPAGRTTGNPPAESIKTKSLDPETIAASLAAAEEANAVSLGEMQQLNDRMKKLYAAISL